MTELISLIESFEPLSLEEEREKDIMLRYAREHSDCLLRSDKLAHFTASAWIVNKERTKVLFIYHKIYNSWSWVGGHADGDGDLSAVALKEAREETGISTGRLVSDKAASLEILTVDAHYRRGEYVAPHLHFNLTFLIEADENEPLKLNEDETNGVKWFTPDEALKASDEPKMKDRVYKKLMDRAGL